MNVSIITNSVYNKINLYTVSNKNIKSNNFTRAECDSGPKLINGIQIVPSR